MGYSKTELFKSNMKSLEMKKSNEQQVVIRTDYIIAFIVVILLVCGISSWIMSISKQSTTLPSVKTVTKPTASLLEPTPEKTTTTAPTKQPDMLERIRQTVYTTGKYDVSIFDDKSRMDERAKPPYDIIVNTYGSEDGNVSSCFYGKNIVYEIIKDLYSDKEIRLKIGRVLVNASPYVSGSLGANDGIPAIEKDSDLSGGPTNFWEILSTFRSYTDNDLPLKDRTWGELNSGCK